MHVRTNDSSKSTHRVGVVDVQNTGPTWPKSVSLAPQEPVIFMAAIPQHNSVTHRGKMDHFRALKTICNEICTSIRSCVSDITIH